MLHGFKMRDLPCSDIFSSTSPHFFLSMDLWTGVTKFQIILSNNIFYLSTVAGQMSGTAGQIFFMGKVKTSTICTG